MGCYRRLISDAFRRYNRKTSPVEKCLSRNSFSSTSAPWRSGISQPIFRKSDLQNVVKNTTKKSPNFVAKRLYRADFNKEVPRWYQNPRNLAALGFVGGLVVIPVYCWNSEKVPYSKRGNFVLFSTHLETKIGELELKLINKGEILPSHHPDSIRVEKIGQDIIGALRKKLDDDEKTAHLKEFKWQFIVVDEPNNVHAWAFSGGKIVVSTGLLNFLETDAEIATVIAREVGRAVSRHHVDTLSAIMWLAPSTLFMSDHLLKLPRALANIVRATSLISLVSCLLFMTFSCTGQVSEADSIGLLVSASAGYDPRIMPEVYMKLADLAPPLLVVPSFIDVKNRAQQLSKPKIMDEALSIYREALNEKDPNFC